MVTEMSAQDAFEITDKLAKALQGTTGLVWSVSMDAPDSASQTRFGWMASGLDWHMTGITEYLTIYGLMDSEYIHQVGMRSIFQSLAKIARDLSPPLIGPVQQQEPELIDAEAPKECLCGAFTGDNDACPQHGLNTAWRDLWG